MDLDQLFATYGFTVPSLRVLESYVMENRNTQHTQHRIRMGIGIIQRPITLLATLYNKREVEELMKVGKGNLM